MAYNSSKGPQQHGDVKYEGDPLDTQVDFENDFIALKTNGQQRFIVSGSYITSSIPISCSVGITASAYVGDGSGLTNMTGFSPIATYNSSGNDRVITSVDSSTVQGEAGLTYSGTILSAAGQISASLGVTGSLLYASASAGAGTTVIYGGSATWTSGSGLSSKTTISHSGSHTTGSLGTVSTTGGSTEYRDSHTYFSLSTSGSHATGSTGTTSTLGGSTEHSSSHEYFRLSTSGSHATGSDGTTTSVGGLTTWSSGSGGTTVVSPSGSHTTGNVTATSLNTVATVINAIQISSSLPLSASSIHAQTTSSFLGPVGIGITLPLYDLHVNGPGSTVATIDGGSSSDAFLKFATNAVEKAYLKLGSGGNLLMTHAATGGDIILQAKPGGVTTTYLTVDGTRTALTASVAVSASHAITAGSFIGDGAGLTNMSGISPIATYNNAADNRVITSVDATTVQGEAGLTYSGTILSAAGEISASLGVTGSSLNTATTIIDGLHVSSSLNISGSKFYGDGANLTNTGLITSYTNSTDNRVLTSVNSSTVNGEANLTFDGSALAVAGTLAATVANNPVAQLTHPTDNATGAVLELINSKDGNAGDADDFCGGVVFKSTDSTSAATQYGKISTKIGSPTDTSEAGYMLFDITTGGTAATTYLRLDGVTSAVTASVAVSASHGITAGFLNTLTTIIDGLHISSSLNISGSKFYGDGSNLSGITAAPAGSTTQIQYNNAGSVAGSAALTLVNGGLNTNILTASAAALVSGSLDVSGSVRGKQLVYTTHAFTDGGSPPHQGYLPFHDLTENNNADYRHQMSAPFNGTLKKVIFRPKNAQNGAVTLELYIATQGDAAIDNGVIAESVTVTMGATGYTSSPFVLSGSNLIAADDVVGVRYTCNAAPGDTNVTCIWEYDTLGF